MSFIYFYMWKTSSLREIAMRRFIASLGRTFSPQRCGSSPLFSRCGGATHPLWTHPHSKEVRWGYTSTSQHASSTPISTLMVHTLSIASEDPFSNPTLFRSIAGASQYLTFTLCVPTYACFRLLRYVKGTTSCDICILRNSSTKSYAFSNGYWVGCPITRYSTPGFCTFFRSNCITWSSKKQYNTLWHGHQVWKLNSVLWLLPPPSWHEFATFFVILVFLSTHRLFFIVIILVPFFSQSIQSFIHAISTLD